MHQPDPDIIIYIFYVLIGCMQGIKYILGTELNSNILLNGMSKLVIGVEVRK